MEIRPLRRWERRPVCQCADILANTFPCYATSARAELRKLLEKERVLLVALECGQAVGLVGAIPQYGQTGWELHPLVVRADRRGQGIGAALVRALESAVRTRGGVMLYLGSDDENGSTSLANADLYPEPSLRLREIHNLKRHPYEFYQKQGYALVGVLPDANGLGKPDLWLAKTLVPRS